MLAATCAAAPPAKGAGWALSGKRARAAQSLAPEAASEAWPQGRRLPGRRQGRRRDPAPPPPKPPRTPPAPPRPRRPFALRPCGPQAGRYLRRGPCLVRLSEYRPQDRREVLGATILAVINVKARPLVLTDVEPADPRSRAIDVLRARGDHQNGVQALDRHEAHHIGERTLPSGRRRPFPAPRPSSSPT